MPPQPDIPKGAFAMRQRVDDTSERYRLSKLNSGDYNVGGNQCCRQQLFDAQH
jgi:hypothetical protein